MADTDEANETPRQAQELDLQGINVPTDVDEDEAMHTVQQQLADRGMECDAAEVRRIVLEAWAKR